jgi:hypothetical protein
MTYDNRETPVLETLYPTQIPHGQTELNPRLCMGGRRLRTVATAWPAQPEHTQNMMILAHTLLNVQGSHACSSDIFGMQLISSFQIVL